MQMLYDSDTFVVVHINAAEGEQTARHCFEIVDKRANVEVCLHDQWADLFQKHINAWQLKVPEQDEVERTLLLFAGLAQLPLCTH